MEKVGGVFGSDKLQEKGQQKRAQAGADTGYGGSNTRSGNTDTYGSGNTDDNNY
jgi:hypothetical protein